MATRDKSGTVMHGLRAVLMGPPGSGRHTQAEKIAKRFCVCYITADGLVGGESHSGIGREIKRFFNAGMSADDDAAIRMIEENLNKPECKNGFILQDFPTNVKQAEKLDELLKKRRQELDAVIEFNIEEEDASRRQKPSLLTHPKKEEKKTEGFSTGENYENLKNRLSSYRSQAAPVIEYYKRKRIFSSVDATKPPNYVAEEFQNRLKELGIKDGIVFA